MPCPVCAGECVCGHAAAAAATIGEHVAVLIDPENSNVSEAQFQASLDAATAHTVDVTQELEASARAARVKSLLTRELSAVAEPRQSAALATRAREEHSASLPEWRREVASRVTRHRSRRRPRADRNRSLILNFESAGSAPIPPAEITAPEPELGTDEAFSMQVEAYGLGRSNAATAPPTPAFAVALPEETSASEVSDLQLDGSTLNRLTEVVRAVESRTESNLIEFPQTVEPVPDELAEPAIVTPRIFEAEEVQQVEREQEAVAAATAAPQVPSITLHDEPAEPAAPAAMELPFPIAPLRQRACAAMIDAAIVAVACTVFAVMCAAMSALPQGRTLLALAGVVPQIFWALYQYLFLANLGCTPGMMAMRLALADFEQQEVSRRRRQWRAVTMALSSASLGLGLAWALLDQDRLCWHDRITRTFLVQAG